MKNGNEGTMAGTGLLALLDDITTILDDVAAMSKLAAKKTAGIVGDDLAVNANAMIGIDPKRELPIVGKVALGSLCNKAVLIPLALALPAAAITPLLMIGGAFLCYEAFHKMTHKKDAEDEKHHEKMLEAIVRGPEDLAKVENKRVWQAIGTDTILSAEIIAVSLGAVAAAPLLTKALVLSTIGLAMTVGVYGFVAGLVKLDDIGLHLQEAQGGGFAKFKRAFGKGLVDHTPTFMKGLSVVGTAAMFLVGGGILLHGIPGAHHLIEGSIATVSSSGFVHGVLEMAASGAAGVTAGFASVPVFTGLGKLLDKCKGACRRIPGAFKKKAVPGAKKPEMERAFAPGMPESGLKSSPDVKSALSAGAETPAQENAPPGNRQAPRSGPACS